MNEKISYKKIISEKMIDVGNFDYKSTLCDCYKGEDLKKGGVYVLFDELYMEVVYVGVSVNLKRRLNQHNIILPKKLNGGYASKLFSEYKDKDVVKEILKQTTVKVFFEEDSLIQDLLEKYLIAIYKPKYNFARSYFISEENKRDTIKLLNR